MVLTSNQGHFTYLDKTKRKFILTDLISIRVGDFYKN